MHSSGGVLIVRAEEFKQKINVETASILVIVIDEEIVETKTSFLALNRDTYWHNNLSFGSCNT